METHIQAGVDTIELSTGSHTFSTDNKILNIETIVTHTSGSTVILTGQTEGFTITGNSGADIITGANGADTITVELVQIISQVVLVQTVLWRNWK